MVHEMAGARRTELLGRLADISEEAIQRLGDVPGADRAVGAYNSLKERTDDLQRRVRGLEALEQRIDALERKVDKLSKGESPSAHSPARKTTTTKSSSANKREQAE
jgi:hypothetical protein